MQTIVSIPKSTFPFISIPQPGKRPFVYERSKFTRILKGITVTDWGLSDCGEWLEITHATGRVRGRYKLRNQLHVIGKWDFNKRCSEWREAEQKRRKRVPVEGLPKAHQLQIRRLEKKLDSWTMRPTPAPKNPMVDLPYPYALSGQWELQKPSRKQLSAIAAKVLTHGLTDISAYKQIRTLGYKLTIHSKAPVKQGFKPDRTAYWKTLFRYCGLAEKPWNRTPSTLDEQLVRHAERRMEWLSVRRQREEAIAHIAAIKALALPVEAVQYAN